MTIDEFLDRFVLCGNYDRLRPSLEALVRTEADRCAELLMLRREVLMAPALLTPMAHAVCEELLRTAHELVRTAPGGDDDESFGKMLPKPHATVKAELNTLDEMRTAAASESVQLDRIKAAMFALCWQDGGSSRRPSEILRTAPGGESEADRIAEVSRTGETLQVATEEYDGLLRKLADAQRRA